MRWFRLDNIQRADIDHDATYEQVEAESVSSFVAASPDGYHDGTDTEWTFVVAPSAAPWVRGNLRASVLQRFAFGRRTARTLPLAPPPA